MKTLLLCCCATVVPLLPCQLHGEDPAPNLIFNGNLEETTRMTAENLPYPMQPWNEIKDEETAIFSLSQEEKTSGANSLCIERLAPSGHSRVGIDLPIAVVPGKRYVFSCMIKATEGIPLIIFSPYAAPKEPLDGVTMVDMEALSSNVQCRGNTAFLPIKSVVDRDQFTKVEVAFVIPEGTYFLGIAAEFGYSLGKAWFDDFRLVQEDPPVTKQ